MKNFKNKTAAITGAGSGIGRALARQLAAEGCNLALSDIHAERLAETTALIETAGFKVKVTTEIFDVANQKAVYGWAEQCIKDHGAVHLIFNNAGIAQSGTVESNQIEDYEKVLNVNLWGVIYGTKAFLPHMYKQAEGHIVNISSVFGIQAQPGVSAYNTSKFAVRGFTESLRQELDIQNVGVSTTCVHPGGINTNIILDSEMSNSMGAIMNVDTDKLRKLANSFLRTSPEQAAKVILNGVKENARRVLIGADARYFDWQQRLMPTGYQKVNKLITTLVSKL